MTEDMVFGVSEFVSYLNQTLDVAYPYVSIEGELSNFRVSKNRWVYFDIKDEEASVRCFGTVYMLPGPLEDGMTVRVSGNPRLHPLYNFSVTVQSIVPVGQGTIKRAADLLQAKLIADGLFDEERKRPLPVAPQRIGLITAGTSAAYADFIKIANARWAGLTIDHFDVLVQGEQAPGQIVSAIRAANELPEPPEVLVLVRGGGSAEDLAAWSTEAVTRAVAGSRVPTLVAIGHEIDISLSELAADQRASTPSNAAELLLPDKAYQLNALSEARQDLSELLDRFISDRQQRVERYRAELEERIVRLFADKRNDLLYAGQLLEAYNPSAAVQRGYALIRKQGKVLRSVGKLKPGDSITAELANGSFEATVTKLTEGKA